MKSMAHFSESDDFDSLFLTQTEKEQLGIPLRWHDNHIWQPSLVRQWHIMNAELLT
jgi:hypothetical protein